MSPSCTIVLAGPTASGKSALALALAEQLNGTIINADSRQLYGAFPILSALPSAEDQARIPHTLYGILKPDETASVALWLDQAHHAIQQCLQEGRVPILVGGTGFYLQAYLKGLPQVPPISSATQHSIQQALEDPQRSLWAWLNQLDPDQSSRIHPHDTYRTQRALALALEKASGDAIEVSPPSVAPVCFVVKVMPPRPLLRDTIQNRLTRMIHQGALEEVRPFLQAPESWPALTTLGVQPLLNVLKGNVPLDQAVQKIYEQTCQYAKRQNTWFKNKMEASYVIDQMISLRSISEINISLIDTFHSFCEKQKFS